MKHPDLPADFSWSGYRNLNSDLAAFSDAELTRHYLVHGIHEFRPYRQFLSDFVYDPPKKGGVNVLGFVNNISGLSAACRMIAKSLDDSEIAYNLNQFPLEPARDLFMETTDACQYDVNIVCMNPDIGYSRIEPRFFSNRTNIALVFWELEKLPEMWIESLRAFDEIWVSSRYNEETMLRSFPGKTILCLPLKALETEILDQQACKQALGIAPETFVCLFIFDGRSDLYRKNPEAAMAAFRLAFGEEENCLLIIKTHHCTAAELSLLEMEAGSDSRIKIWHEEIPGEKQNVLMNACDLYTSLHRSEGLGLTMMEALLLGKPVVCTGYSGNLDFCSEAWTQHVAYKLVEVQPQSNYARLAAAGSFWADPDPVDAAARIREVYSSYDVHLEKAAAGKKWIEEKYSSRKLDKLISGQLEKYLTSGNKQLKKSLSH